MSDAPERIWALHYECEDEPDAIAIGYPEKFFGTHEYVRADRIEKLEAKLAKCQALMHAGLAEYKRRLVGVIEASIAVRSAQKTYFKDRSKDNLIASKQAETSLDKLLVELEGEIDD